MRLRRRLAPAIVVVLWLALTASAIASRAPTAAERRAITKVAIHAPNAAIGKKVQVSHIRVSTVGPWARATITLFFGSAPDSATDILHKVRGKWIDAGAGTAGEECVMPLKDRHNLGFGSYPCGH
jgi:hypothetical protein